jgi:hypothetical protein
MSPSVAAQQFDELENGREQQCAMRKRRKRKKKKKKKNR